MAKNEQKPAIRFQGFTDAWEQRKVTDMFKITRGYVLAAPLTSEQKSDEMPYPVYSSQTKDQGLMGYYKEYLYEDAITWTTDGANAGTVNYRAGKFYCTNVCGVLLVDKVVPNQMIAEALNNVAKGHVSYVGNPKLMNNVMAEIEISLPSSAEERDRITEFFSEVDDLITLHQRKYDKLLSIKKSMLEKMFPRDGSKYPEIRFSGFTDPWEQRKLGHVFVEYSEKGHPELPALTIIQGGGTVRRDESERSLQYDKASLVNYKMVNAEDFIVHLRSFEGGLEKATTLGIISPAYHTFHGEGTDSRFYYSYFRSKRFIEQDLKPHVYGIRDGRSIDIEGMKTIEIPWTSYTEQQVIGNYIDTMDNLITLHQRKLEKLKNIKKSMLEKMFV